MCSESVCHVARSLLDVGNFHKRLVVRFMNLTSVRNILDSSSKLGLLKVVVRNKGRRIFVET
jgi:hypothetical protein